MDCNMESTMGKRISARRKELGLTQEGLAAALGVSPQAVSKWENDQSCPDISILPALAKLLGMTTDALLGMEWATDAPASEAPVRVLPAEESEPAEEPHTTVGAAHQSFGRRRRMKSNEGLAALWLISVGALMLLELTLFHRDIGLWTALWTTGILYIGIGALRARHIFIGSAATLGGAYLIAERLGFVTWGLSWQAVLAVLIVLLGVSLLFRKAEEHKRKGYRVTGTDYHIEDGFFSFSGSFGEEYYTVVTPLLKGGSLSSSFGEFTVDLTKVEAISEDCTIEINASFGETKLLVPKRFRVELEGNKSFAELALDGEPDAVTQGVIYVCCNASFGETRIRYV